MPRRDIGNNNPPAKEDGVVTAKSVIARAFTSVVAGGDTTPVLTAGPATGGLGLYWGSGAPTITAPQGSLYMNTTGSSVSTRLYVNTTGSTTWTAVTTAA